MSTEYLIRRSERGQAMVEFAVMVFVIIIIGSTSVGLYRALQFDWWAQHDARFLAFGRALGDSSPASRLSAQNRPRYVAQVRPDYAVWSEGNVESLVRQSISSPGLPSTVGGEEEEIADVPHGGRRPSTGSRSQFARSVASAANAAPTSLRAAQISLAQQAQSDPAMSRMTRNVSYLGAQVALGEILYEFGRLALASTTSLDSDAQVTLENSVNSKLHADVSSSGVIPGLTINAFWLVKMPLPGVSYTGAFDGVMKNVLSNDGSLRDPWMNNDVVHSSVSYTGLGGSIAGLPLRRLNTTGASAQFTLVTEPWKIARRESPTGAFRQPGDQTDSIDSTSDEGVMRRRVAGLWLFPSDVVALAEPMTNLLPGSLRGVVSDLEGPISTGVTMVKRIIIDANPLEMLFDVLNELPVVSELDLHLPQWPSVRPDSYPGSSEMYYDELSGSQRGFNDYVQEQRDNQ
ncbi:MAG: hypothetical protein IT290_05550 [Deltaproteobacteria bacterium]|nr:hypothetical protein [Deltaproteobacteria bacterium]